MGPKLSKQLALKMKGRRTHKKALMKQLFLSMCFILILFETNISYASEILNHQTTNTRVYGILGEDTNNNNEVEENQLHPKEEISTIIINPDKKLPETGGYFSFISTLLGTMLISLGILMSIVKCINKKRNWSEEIR